MAPHDGLSGRWQFHFHDVVRVVVGQRSNAWAKRKHRADARHLQRLAP